MAWLVLFFILLGCGSGESGQPLAFWRLAPANNVSVFFFFLPSLAGGIMGDIVAIIFYYYSKISERH
jgi:hypothetical protein